jgi:surfactin synthase thioesterase subunit/acyl carrier protein
MNRDVDQIAVAAVDWPTYAGKVGAPPFLTEVLNRTKIFGSSTFSREAVPPAASSMDVNGQARQQLLSRLQQHIAEQLGFTEVLDPNERLNDLGVDSLASVALSNSLEKEFGIPVSIAELIMGPTINQLGDYLADMFAGAQPDQTAETRPPITSAAARALATSRNLGVESVRSMGADLSIASDRYHQSVKLQRVTNRPGSDEAATNSAGKSAAEDFHRHAATPLASSGGTLFSRPTRDVAELSAGKWLLAPRANPNAKVRLFCFPFAGGGLVSFRAWPQLLDDSVELVAVEAPGRGTRIHETAVDDLNTFVERLLPEIVVWLDRPSAFFGHCLGGLTMFATLCALPEACARFVKHSFACGIRPPHLLKRRGEFEDNLAYDVMLDRDVDVRLPFYSQSDEIFSNIIRRFDTPAADRMLEIPKLRKALLPTIRAEFKMAYHYEYRPVEPFAFPISSFVGDLDPWVSTEDSAGWGDFTRAEFINHVRKGSHFLMADNREYILETINKAFTTAPFL